jgi:hypothetical protein
MGAIFGVSRRLFRPSFGNTWPRSSNTSPSGYHHAPGRPTRGHPSNSVVSVKRSLPSSWRPAKAPKMASLHPIQRARSQAKSKWCKPAYRGPIPLYSSFFHPSCSLDRKCIPSSLPGALSFIFFLLLFLPSFLLPWHWSCPLINQLLVHLSVCSRPLDRIVLPWSQSSPASSAPSPSLPFPQS